MQVNYRIYKNGYIQNYDNYFACFFILQVRRVWLNQDGDALAVNITIYEYIIIKNYINCIKIALLKDFLSLRHSHVSIPQITSETAIIKAVEHLFAPLDDLILYHLK